MFNIKSIRESFIESFSPNENMELITIDAASEFHNHPNYQPNHIIYFMGYYNNYEFTVPMTLDDCHTPLSQVMRRLKSEVLNQAGS